jgi:hypothetical protein
MNTKISMNMPEALEAYDVEITAAAILSDGEYQSILASGTLPERFIDRLKYTNAVTETPFSCLIKSYKAMLVMSENSEHGIAVCGGDSVYRSGFFPNAKEIIENRINKMADFACSLKDLPDGNRHDVPLEMLGDSTNMTVTNDNGIGEMLLDELKTRDEISEIIMHEDCFEIEYALNYEQNYTQNNENYLSVAGLFESELQDFHLLHVDEEHELATIVEIYPDTLTEQGREDWSDILDAKVERIYNGYYGIQADISGCEAERLRDFSYMLAGDCPVSDYEKWVNDKDVSHDISMQ